MNRHPRPLAPILIVLALVLRSTAGQELPSFESTPTSNRPPNIVFILIDDLGWSDLGCMGNDFYQTPRIDALAADGMRFQNAYANAPNCAPSRACLLSGQYGPRHGVYTVGSPERGAAALRKIIPTSNRITLPPEIITIAEALQTAGYATASIGKWHLGEGSETGPEGQGFALNVAGNQTGSPRGGHFSPYRNPQLANGPKGEYLTDRLTDEACAFIAAHKDEPFFLYLSHYAVHTPIQARDALTRKYENKPPGMHQRNAAYAAMIESVDESVGRVNARLADLGLTDNTIVIFFSDNGGHGKITSNAPLRGAKGMLYEGGIREPMIVRWPGVIEPGSRCATPVIGTDFYPTLIEAAGVTVPGHTVLDGVSLLPLWRGSESIPERPIFWHFPAYLEGKNYSGARDEQFRTRPCGAVRLGNWKLIEYFEDGVLELYNLNDDVAEARNVREQHPEKAAQLHDLLKSWRQSVKAPVPTDANPAYEPAPSTPKQQEESGS